MHKRIQILLCLLVLLVCYTSSKAQPYLFSEPRQGGFKFKQNDRFDITNGMHYAGSGMLALAFYKILKSDGGLRPKISTGLLASALGFMKEFEDGYREGWGMKDAIFNQLGIISFLMFSEHLHFSATVEQVISISQNYGLGVRYFRTSEFTPLNASLGLFAHTTSQKEGEAGVDLHVLFLGRTELHLGLTLAAFKNDIALSVRRPNVGLAFRMF